ncbi:MAG: UDP-N-acetylmuramate--L-alanine ligase, partial [Bacteroidia bacterium]|nr:UDP-N-acetylmuramate--L-alanine ligase [Bacteroidia bacterium]
TKALESENISVFYETNTQHIDQADIIIYTPAIKNDNIEFAYAQKTNKPIFKRSEVLGWIVKNYRSIAIGGTHGKTTISSMVTSFLWNCGYPVTGFIGGIIKQFQSNFVYSPNASVVVVEADEFDRSFLRLFPTFAVISSIDPDHLDIYGTKEEVQNAYLTFAHQIQPDGILLLADTILNFPFYRNDVRVIRYGFSSESEVRAENIKFRGTKVEFDYVWENQETKSQKRIKEIILPFPGKHNVSNAIAAITLCLINGISVNSIQTAVSNYQGVWRRFEIHLDTPTLTYIDDYAHHPTEIEAAIQAAKQLYPNRKLITTFQPHLYSRTRDFAPEFAKALSLSDEVLLLDIYPARELSIPGVTSELIFQQITCRYKQPVTLSSLPETILS